MWLFEYDSSNVTLRAENLALPTTAGTRSPEETMITATVAAAAAAAADAREGRHVEGIHGVCLCLCLCLCVCVCVCFYDCLRALLRCVSLGPCLYMFFLYFVPLHSSSNALPGTFRGKSPGKYRAIATGIMAGGGVTIGEIH